MTQTPDSILDDTPLTFGKYKGKTPNDLLDDDPSYLVWSYENVTTRPVCSTVMYKAALAEKRKSKQALISKEMREKDKALKMLPPTQEDKDLYPGEYEYWKQQP